MFAVVVVLVGVAIVGNDYRFKMQQVEFQGPDGVLSGVLTMPPEGDPRGLVLMVHGDGPVEATQEGLYSPWFEAAADSGFATLSWDKPGIEGSEGDWLSQSMEDRALEVSAAIDWAQQQDGVPSETLVLWGASQAGWVMPKVARDREDIDGIVAVGTAINWLRQGRFNLLAELRHEDADVEQRDRAIAESDKTRNLLEQGGSYDEYVSLADPNEPMTEGRWEFVQRNFSEDATSDLRASARKEYPVLLMRGDSDRNVDMAETEATYREIFGPRLSIASVNGAHSLARPIMEDSAPVGIVTGTLWPRALLAPGVTSAYSDFLDSI